MKIKYVNSTDDVKAYARLLYEKSPRIKQHLKKALYTAAILIVIFGIVIYLLEEAGRVLYIWMILSVLWLTYIPFQHRKKYLNNMIKSFADDNHRNFFGNHTLTLEDDLLIDEIENGINRTSLNEIEHIETVKNHTFIFVRSAMAYAICSGSITEGSYNEFIKALKKKIKTKGEIK